MVGPKTDPKIFYSVRTSHFRAIDCEVQQSDLSLQFSVSLPKPCRKSNTSRTGGLTTLQPLLRLKIPPPPRQPFRRQLLKRPPFPPSKKKTVCLLTLALLELSSLLLHLSYIYCLVFWFPCFRSRVSLFQRCMS